LDTDPSRFAPAHASAAEWENIQSWRKSMNEAVSSARKANKKPKP